jgi:hypothetical protein
MARRSTATGKISNSIDTTSNFCFQFEGVCLVMEWSNDKTIMFIEDYRILKIIEKVRYFAKFKRKIWK